MARDLELPITAPGAAATSASIAGVAKQVDNLGDESARAARQVDKLNDELAETDRQLKALASSYADSGNQKFFKEMRELARTRASQKRALQLLTPDLPPPPPPVPGGGGGLFSQALGTPFLPAAVGLGVLAAPAIGAAINAALLAGIGSAGIGAGIASAIRQDNTIQTEFKRLAGDFVSIFDAAGKPFIEPVRGAASFLRSELGKIREDWVSTLGGMSELVEPLTRGVSGLFTEMSPGFLRALEASKPVIEALAQELPGLGRDLDDMFGSFAAGGPGAVEGMRMLVKAIGDAAVATGNLVEHLSKAFDKLTDWGQAVGQFAPLISGMWGPFLAGANEAEGATIKAKGGFDKLGDSVAQTATDFGALGRTWDDMMDRFITLDQAQIRTADAFRNVTETIKEYGKSLSLATENGTRVRESIVLTVEQLQRERDAMIENGVAGNFANKVYDQQIAQLRNLATAMGVSRAELDKLISKYNSLQSKSVTLTIRQVFTAQGPAFRTSGGVTFMSEGGPVVGSGPRGVDSALLVGAPGEYMLNTDMVDQLGGVQALERMRKGGSAFMSMPAGGGGTGSGGGGTAVSINYSGGGSGLDNLFLSWLHEAVRTGRLQLKVGGNRVTT